MLAPVTHLTPRVSPADAQGTVRLAHRILGRLVRMRVLPAERWRATCLYRSVTECMILRELGYPARVLIGARADVAGGTIAAHAWVECAGIECMSLRGDEQYEVLNASSAATAVL